MTGWRDYPAAVERGAVPFVWVHGGAFSYGGLDQLESHSVALAVAASGRPVRTVDYRLVPPSRLTPSENRYPAAKDDVIAAVRDLGSPVILGGASAGAMLVASAVGSLDVAGVVLAYGLFHPELPSPHAHGPGLFTADEIRAITLNYVGDPAMLADASAFPALGAHRFPPTLFVDADRDSLRSSSEAFAAQLDASGTPVTRAVIPGTGHGFFDQPELPGFDEGIGAIVGWLDQQDPVLGVRLRGDAPRTPDGSR